MRKRNMIHKIKLNILHLITCKLGHKQSLFPSFVRQNITAPCKNCKQEGTQESVPIHPQFLHDSDFHFHLLIFSTSLHSMCLVRMQVRHVREKTRTFSSHDWLHWRTPVLVTHAQFNRLLLNRLRGTACGLPVGGLLIPDPDPDTFLVSRLTLKRDTKSWSGISILFFFMFYIIYTITPLLLLTKKLTVETYFEF